MFTRDQQGQYLVPSHPNPYTCERRPNPCFCSHAIIALMITKLTHVSILVPDLDEALAWYTNVLDLEKREDNSSVVAGFRWLTVAPKGQADPEIVLFLPGPFQAEEDRKILLSRVGQGPMWMFHTDDCAKEYERLSGLGVKFHQTPETVPWGVQAVFEDLYGNQFGILEPANL